MTEAEELARAKKSFSAHKGVFGRLAKTFEARLASYRKNPEVVHNWTELEEVFMKVKKSYDKLEDALTNLEILEPDPELQAQFNPYYKSMEDYHKEFGMAAEMETKDRVISEAGKEDVQRQLVELQRQLDAQATASGGGGGLPKLVAKSELSLKPEVLTKSMKPVEYRSWVKKFNDWYGTSNFNLTTVENQIAYLRSVMEAELVDQVDFEGATTIQEAMDRVEREFKKTHPLLNRRVTLLTMKQPEGQLMSDHLVAFKQVGKEADVDTMSPEDLKAVLIISSCTNKELVTKLLEMSPAEPDKPTVAELEKVITDFEVRKKSEELLNPDSKSRRVDASKVKCFKCQKRGHFWRDCKESGDKPKGEQGAPEKSKFRKKKPKKKDKSRRSQTPGPNGEGSGTETEGEESSPENVDTTRRTVTKINATTRRTVTAQVTARARRGVEPTSNPTPPIDLEVKTKASQRESKLMRDSIPDTGCTSTVIKSKEAARLKLKIDKDVDINLTDATGKPMRTDGMATMFIKSVQGATKRIRAIVSPDLADTCLISWNDLIKLEYLPKGWPHINKVRRTHTTTLEEGEENQLEEKPWPPPEWGEEVVKVVKEFSHLFKDKLDQDSRIKCPPMDIEFKEGAELPQTHHSRFIPFHLKGMADECLNDNLKAGVVERAVDAEGAAPAHFVEKYDNEGNIVGVRLVCDLTKLNKAVKRPAQSFPTGNQIWQNVDPNSRKFFKLDLTSGYHQIPLSKEARKYFNFILPQGRFRYTSAPMGFVASGDWFNQVTDRCFRGIQGIQKEVDDILGHAVTDAELARQLREVFKICQEYNISLSKRKMEVGENVHFAGFMVGVDGLKPDPGKIVALKNFKTPTTATEMRSFLGAVNQMSCWWPDLSQHCVRLRELTHNNTTWNWLPEHEEDFQRIKNVLSDTANLAPYDPKRKTELITDASRVGIGFVLVQFDEVAKKWRLVWANSTALKGAQKRYSPIQLELLGLTWALQSCKFYLRGNPGFLVKTDHNPLVGLFKRDIRDTSEKLQPLLEACSLYNFRIEYIPGKKNKVADLLSRYPVWSEGPTVFDKCGRVVAFNSQHKMLREDPRIAEIMVAAGTSTKYKEAVKAKLDGLTAEEVKQLPKDHGAREYQKWWNTIGVLDDKEDTIMIMDDHRIIVPVEARQSILKLLHVPHMAATRTKKAATKRYFWVGMADEVKKMCEHCQSCRERGPSRPEEPLEMPIPKAAINPMEMIGLDIAMHAGIKYLICIDRYSGYPLVGRLGKTSSTNEVIKTIQGWFRTFGYAKRARHDDGPEFRDRFVAWLKQVGCKSELASAYNPASNGLAEAGVKNVKNLLKKCLDGKECFETALAEFRIAPRDDGYSPAELFYKRQVRGLLPELPKKLNIEEAEKARDKAQEAYTAQRQTRSTSKPLSLNQKVWLQDQQTKRWTIDGIIKSIRDGGKSYVVETDGGAYLRNRRYIKAACTRIKQVAVGTTRRANLTAGQVEEVMRKKKTVSFKKAVYFNI